jgi:hypothetical protein
VAPGVAFILMGGLHWLMMGEGRRFLGVLPMLLGVLVLAITTMTSCEPTGPGPAGLVTGVVVSVSLGWCGYRVQRRMPREPSGNTLLAVLVTPAPSTRVLRPQDVQGRWRFCVDVVARAVTVDLQADGRYEQVIVSFSGERIEGSRGVWTLDGPNLQLSAYRSAIREVTSPVRWFFGDWENDLVLFVKDDPQAKTTLLGLRTEQADVASIA